MQALNRPLSLALAGALLLCLTGCGQIRPSGTTDSAAVKDELYKLNYPGVTGDTQFDEIGDVHKAFVKVEIQDGKFVELT